MSWVGVAVAVGATRAVVGGVQANNERQRQKGVIGQAYTQGQQRLNLHQQDTRQAVAEDFNRRGLAGGGGVRLNAAAVPGQPGQMLGVSGAHDLASQGAADLAREQGLEQTNLAVEADNARAGVNAQATQNIIGSVGAGVETGVQAYSAGSTMGSGGGTGSSLQGAQPMGTAPDSPYKGSAYGIDPVNPLGRGAWAQQSNSDFNVYGNKG